MEAVLMNHTEDMEQVFYRTLIGECMVTDLLHSVATLASIQAMDTKDLELASTEGIAKDLTLASTEDTAKDLELASTEDMAKDLELASTEDTAKD